MSLSISTLSSATAMARLSMATICKRQKKGVWLFALQLTIIQEQPDSTKSHALCRLRKFYPYLLLGQLFKGEDAAPAEQRRVAAEGRVLRCRPYEYQISLVRMGAKGKESAQVRPRV